MGIIILIVVGGILGWLASIVMRTDGQQGILLNVVVGIVGALLGGFLLAPLFNYGGSITEAGDGPRQYNAVRPEYAGQPSSCYN